jgi:glycosyltransferase involved in cell wall biosynthesis/SAM-dependent methyltransferase
MHCGTCGALTRPDALKAEEDIIEGADYLAPEEAKDAAYADGLYRLEALAPGRELIDIGAGHGRFLEKAGARGWKALGIEAGPKASAAAREKGLDVRTGRIQDQKFDRPFSAATLWDVLEVLNDPIAALRKARESLVEGGVVLVRVRNADIHLLAQRRLGFVSKRLKSAAPVFHRFAFGPAGLKAAFKKAGLETLDIVNSPATTGDPYGKGSRAVSLLKSTLGAAAGAAYIASRGQTLLGSSILGIARRPRVTRTVMHLITRLDPGGSSEGTLQMVRDWSDPKITLSLASGPGVRRKGAPPAGPAEGVPVHWVEDLIREVRVIPDVKAWFELLRLLDAARPDILHTHSSKAGVLGRSAAEFLKRMGRAAPRIVHTPHGHVFYGYFGRGLTELYRRVEAVCAPWTGRFIALTEGEKRESVERGIGTAEQWRVAPSGVPLPEDPKAFAAEGRRLRASFGAKEGEIVVGTLMRLEVVKGPHVWAEAAALAARRSSVPLRFVTVGDGPLLRFLSGQVERLGLKDLWRFAGQTDKVFEHLAALDVYVQPSLNEGMGRGLVQAQSMGLPVAASRVCGIPDVVKEGETGVLVPSADPDALARAIVDLAADKAKRERLGRAGAAWVRSKDETGHPRFSQEAMRARLKVVYEGLLAERPK